MTEFTKWRSLVDGEEISAIPDTSMFQSPLYQFTADLIGDADGETVDFPEAIADLSDATAVNNPTFREDQDGYPAVEYDRENEDAHDWTPDSQLPTGDDSHSIAALVHPRVGEQMVVFAYGDDEEESETRLEVDDSGELRHDFFNNNTDSGDETVNDSEWNTIGMSYDGSERTLFINGESVSTDTAGSVNVDDVNHAIARWRANDSRYFDGFISEVILSSDGESASAFEDYHNDRID